MIRSIPAYLVVISLIRGAQIILSCVLFTKVLVFNVPFTFEVFCRSNAVAQVNYDASFPFAWLTIQAPNDCSDQAVNTTTYLWTGMGPTVYLYMILSAFMIIYPILAILFYLTRFDTYDSQKKLPAVDLLISLVNGLLWIFDAYLAWHNLGGLKESCDPDKVISSTTVCSASGGYCSPGIQGEFSDLSSFLFLALACALSWGIAVWFIFMETGLAPEDEDDDLMYSDLAEETTAIRAGRLPALVPPFSSYSVDEKAEQGLPGTQYSYDTEYGMAQENTERALATAPASMDGTFPNKEQLMLAYVNAWKQSAGGEFDDQNLAAMFGSSFAPPSGIKTVSTRELERDTIGNKVHSKWNLFKA